MIWLKSLLRVGERICEAAFPDNSGKNSLTK